MKKTITLIAILAMLLASFQAMAAEPIYAVATFSNNTSKVVRVTIENYYQGEINNFQFCMHSHVKYGWNGQGYLHAMRFSVQPLEPGDECYMRDRRDLWSANFEMLPLKSDFTISEKTRGEQSYYETTYGPRT